jgi:ribonuclease VapC
MAEAILDASAVLADIHGEPGHEMVRASARTALMSAINFAEVISQLRRHGVPELEAVSTTERMGFEVVNADKLVAIDAGGLLGAHWRSGVSLADAFCLALGRERRLPVLTADRRWAALDVGVEVRLIR